METRHARSDFRDAGAGAGNFAGENDTVFLRSDAEIFPVPGGGEIFVRSAAARFAADTFGNVGFIFIRGAE